MILEWFEFPQSLFNPKYFEIKMLNGNIYNEL